MTGADRRKSLETIFEILDLDKDGFINRIELEKIMIATRSVYEGDNFGSEGNQNTFEQRGRDDAEKIIKKCDTNNIGKIDKKTFISTLFEDPEFEEFQKRFNLDDKRGLGPYYNKPGKTPLSLGDLLKD